MLGDGKCRVSVDGTLRESARQPRIAARGGFHHALADTGATWFRLWLRMGLRGLFPAGPATARGTLTSGSAFAVVTMLFSGERMCRCHGGRRRSLESKREHNQMRRQEPAYGPNRPGIAEAGGHAGALSEWHEKSGKTTCLCLIDRSPVSRGSRQGLVKPDVQICERHYYELSQSSQCGVRAHSNTTRAVSPPDRR
jgi:hypothetical protein